MNSAEEDMVCDPGVLGSSLKERILPFGWIEDLPGNTARLVTDHSGSRPLYYAQQQGQVLSGLTPLSVARKMAAPKLDPVSVADFLVNGTVCYPYTLFEGVYAAPPGAVTDVTAEKVTSSVYYRPVEEEIRAPLEVWGEWLRERAQEALLTGIEGKQNIKVMFSGGEDSRAVVSLIPRDIPCELVTFADWRNREVKLAERAAAALQRPLVFVQRPDGFYRADIQERVHAIGGVFDIRHTHVWGALAEPFKVADAVVGGYAADSLFKSAWMGNVQKSRKRLGPERMIAEGYEDPTGIESAVGKEWINQAVGAAVDERRMAHHEYIKEFRPLTAGNWHTLWPLGSQRITYSHHLATRLACSCVVEPFLSPQAYSLAAKMSEELKVDRKAFRQAFMPLMGKAGWLPTSSGHIPKLGGHVGRWVEMAMIASRRGRDRMVLASAPMLGRKTVGQGAWNKDHHGFPLKLEQQISPIQLEQINGVLSQALSREGAGVLAGRRAGGISNIVCNRMLQLAYLMDPFK